MDTLGYYNTRSQEFLKKALPKPWPEFYTPFIDHIPDGGHILDAGCGSGRDSKAFLEQGFQVTAFDGSEEMVRIASELTGQPVAHQYFHEIKGENLFDGIWKNAALLHVPFAEMATLFPLYSRALKPQGVWHMSFKYGEGEKERQGRFFQDYIEETLRKLLEPCPHLKILYLEKEPDTRPNR